MKKLASLVVIMSVAACGGEKPPASPTDDVSFAPTGNPTARSSSAAVPASAAPAAPPEKSKWLPYTSVAGGFTGVFPCAAPIEEVAKGGNPHFKFTSHIVHCPDRKTTEPLYSIEYWTDATVSAEMKAAGSASEIDAMLAEAMKDQLSAAYRTKGMQVTSKPITFGGLNGYEIDASQSGAHFIQRNYLKLPRQFAVMIVNAEMGIDSETTAFMDAFKITR